MCAWWMEWGRCTAALHHGMCLQQQTRQSTNTAAPETLKTSRLKGNRRYFDSRTGQQKWCAKMWKRTKATYTLSYLFIYLFKKTSVWVPINLNTNQFSLALRNCARQGQCALFAVRYRPRRTSLFEPSVFPPLLPLLFSVFYQTKSPITHFKTPIL